MNEIRWNEYLFEFANIDIPIFIDYEWDDNNGSYIEMTNDSWYIYFSLISLFRFLKMCVGEIGKVSRVQFGVW